MRPLLTILAVVLILPSGLLFFLTSACTGMYSGRRPTGPDAMGLAIPFFTTIGAALATLLATWLTVAAGGFNWMSPVGVSNARSLGFLIASALAIGVGLGSFLTFMCWAEGRSGSAFIDRIFAPVGIAVGLVGPLLFCGIVLISALAIPNPDRAATLDATAGVAGFLRILVYALAPLALIGYLMAGTALAFHAKHKLAREAEIAERYEADRKEEARREALSPVERLREDFATHSPDSPLWIYIASLPDEEDAACRELYISRSRMVPGFENDFVGTLTHEWPRYAHGCLVLWLNLPADAVIPTAPWSAALAKAIATAAAQIRDEEVWLIPDHHRNPDPIGFIRAIVAVASRLGKTEALAAALHELRSAVAARPESPERTEALAALGTIPADSTTGTAPH